MPLHPPEDGAQFDDDQAAKKALQAFAVEQGYSISSRRSLNYVNGKPTRHDLVCGFGGKPYQTTSKGIRKPRSKKTACPFKLKLVWRKARGCWLVETVCGDHNHQAAEITGAAPAQDDTEVLLTAGQDETGLQGEPEEGSLDHRMREYLNQVKGGDDEQSKVVARMIEEGWSYLIRKRWPI